MTYEMFVQISEEADAELWELNSDSWPAPPDGFRFRVRLDDNGASIQIGKLDDESGDFVWKEEERHYATFDHAASIILDRYFFQPCFEHEHPRDETDYYIASDV